MSITARMLPFSLRRDFRNRLRDCLCRYLQPGNLVCDIGCGARPFSELLSHLGCSQVGIDTIDGFYGEDVCDIVANADAIPVADGVADAVLSTQVIEHLPDPDMAIDRLVHHSVILELNIASYRLAASKKKQVVSSKSRKVGVS